MKKAIGKNTLGGGNKMNVDLKTYNRSSHNLSYAWRSSMTVGTLVPFMKEVGLPGDTFDVELETKVFTHPTLGPLFGSFKMQLDIFTCPIRLYNAMLHNNTLNIGMDMSKVKLPKIKAENPSDTTYHINNSEEMWKQVNPSSILCYLGIKELYDNKSQNEEHNAVPLLAYLDIFKNYYANKQEEKFYYISDNRTPIQNAAAGNQIKYGNGTTYPNNQIVGGTLKLQGTSTTTANNLTVIFYGTEETGTQRITANNRAYIKSYSKDSSNIVTLTFWGEGQDEIPANLYGALIGAFEGSEISLKAENLTDLDSLREDYILNAGRQEVIFTESNGIQYLKDLMSINQSINAYSASTAQNGLLIKTHQSDIFNNWILTDWIDGENGISAITSIDTSSGSFSIDTLNLSKKVYDMLNRIAISGGSYKDWIDTVYTSDFQIHAESPIYEGGMSKEIEFEEVVSNSAAKDEPLGTLAGRGYDSPNTKKGGKLHIKIKEPAYVIGIVSITPRVDYAQAEDWDIHLDTMDDLHKPALDGIGFQDLIEKRMVFYGDPNKAIGKQPAWINYMTNYNKVFGNFAIQGNEAFMCLTKWYESTEGEGENDYPQTKISSYIEPTMFNYMFADTDITAQNFWVQIGVGLTARRVMSAKQIPNL